MKRYETDLAGPVADDRSSKRRRKKAALKEFRRAVLARAKVPGGWKCERCGKVYRYEDQIEAHHRLPRSQGGSNCIGNSAALCRIIDPDWVNCHVGVHLHITEDDQLPWEDFIVLRNTLRIDR